MEEMTGGKVVVDSLLRNGVEVAFGIPGTHSLPIYRHLALSSLRHVTPRHEQGAGYAADGYARSSGRIAPCLVTTGPGVTNIATAIGQAYSDSIPLLVVSPGMPADVEGGDRGFLHEAKNQSLLTSAVAAWSHRATSQQDLADALRRAFAYLSGGRPRPVHIEAPIEVLAGEGPVGEIAPAEHPAPVRPSAEAIERAARALEAGRRRALVLGGGARGAAAEATALADALSAAVATTTNGKGVVSERHPLSLGASVMARSVRSHLADCDVVLVVGTELGDSDLWGEPLSLNGTVIRLDVDPGQLDKNLSADLRLHGDAALTLRALGDRLGASVTAGGTGREEAMQEVARVRTGVASDLSADLQPFGPLMASLEKVLAPDAVVAGDAAMACYYGVQFLLPFERPSQWLFPTGFCTLGYGLPAAIGAKLALPDRQVMAIMGDGGVMFTIAELATAVQLGLSLPLVVVTNNGYGEIRKELAAMGVPPLGTDFLAPDFVALARAFGAHGVRVAPDEVGTAVEEAFGRAGPTVVETPAG